MSGTRYTLLFQIEILHGYFAGGPCGSLALSPTGSCAALLARYGMLFRATNGGGAVYRPLWSDAVRGFDESAPFTFSLQADPELSLYTEMDPAAAGAPSETLFYFDNSADYAAEVFGAQRQLLHAPNKPFAKAVLPVRPYRFSASFDASSSASLQVLDPLSKSVLWPVSAEQNQVPFVDLRRLPEGRYILARDGEVLQTFYLMDQAPKWGAISIYAGGSAQSHLPANCRVIDSQDQNPPQITPKIFTLALDARKTIWRYYIIAATSTRDLDSYELTGAIKRATRVENGAAIDLHFLRQPETLAIDGRAAWVFESQSPIPLLHSPASEFSLTLRPGDKGARGDQPIRLPYARPAAFARKGDADSTLCSEVFVYV